MNHKSWSCWHAFFIFCGVRCSTITLREPRLALIITNNGSEIYWEMEMR